MSHKVDSLSLLPADLDLSGIEIELAMRIGREHRLRIALEGAMEQFDLIIIDTPASLGLLTVNALTAADWLLIPIQAEFYALESMGQLLDTLQKVQSRVNPSLKLLGISMTMVQTGSILGKMVGDSALRHFGERILLPAGDGCRALAKRDLLGGRPRCGQKQIRIPGAMALSQNCIREIGGVRCWCCYRRCVYDCAERRLQRNTDPTTTRHAKYLPFLFS